jgi:queuine tRNA-ribosyltransferase
MPSPDHASDAATGVATDVAHTAARLPAALGPGPHFMPDATYGVVRATGPDDLERAGVRIVMTNAFHLMIRPGITTVRALGGVKSLLGWNGVVATDSGGFQAFSLIRQNSRYGRIDAHGLTVIPEGATDRISLTPEKAVQNQLRLGGDILFCLDDCTHPSDPADQQELSVRRTIAWARDCKEAFVHGLAQRRTDLDAPDRPRLFGVIQGGRSPELRRACAEALLEIGFDGYGFGGWPIDEDGELLRDMLQLTRELVPRPFPMHALGVGHPGSVAACSRMGYDLFDSALPTRDARRGRLYAFRSVDPDLRRDPKEWLETVYIQDERHMKDDRPLSEGCTGPCCTRHSRGYLHHLHRIEDALYLRLATLHNLAFMRRLTDLLRHEATPAS